jgi:two-component system, OmpR family, sensor kinase
LSLRTRLLLALGAVALVALIAADVATYSSLKSFLTSRVDEQLDATHDSIVQALYHPGGPPGGPGPGSSQPAPSEPDNGSPPQGSTEDNSPDTNDAASMFQRLAPGTFVALLKPDGTVITQQPYVEEGGIQLEPRIPSHLATSKSNARNPQPSTYFNTGSVQRGGSSFRVSATQFSNGDVLLVAVPLSGEHQTLDRLLEIELAVTGGALILAGLIGWSGSAFARSQPSSEPRPPSAKGSSAGGCRAKPRRPRWEGWPG